VPLVLSVQNLACVDCAQELETRAAAQPGVLSAHFDQDHVELDLQVVPGTAAPPIVAAVETGKIDGRTITVLTGAGQGRFAPFAPLDPSWDAKIISAHGEDVPDFALTPGRVNVVDFYADWCGPCHELDEVMDGLLIQQPGRLAYRRLDIVDWDSPLAKHYLTDAPELPYVLIFDGKGQQIGSLAGLHEDDLRALIAKGESGGQ
jgi:thiol-disulfide isomerase/thioredoxin